MFVARADMGAGVANGCATHASRGGPGHDRKEEGAVGRVAAAKHEGACHKMWETVPHRWGRGPKRMGGRPERVGSAREGRGNAHVGLGDEQGRSVARDERVSSCHIPWRQDEKRMETVQEGEGPVQVRGGRHREG